MTEQSENAGDVDDTPLETIDTRPTPAPTSDECDVAYLRLADF